MKTLKFILLCTLFSSFFLGSCMKEGLRGPAGPIGEPGTQGPAGDRGNDGMGNANVFKYTLNIGKSDWVQKDLGNNNIVMAYEISDASTGYISLLNENYVVYAYGALTLTGNVYPQRKILPFVFGMSNVTPAYGIRLELLLGDGSEEAKAMVAISKVIGGFDNGPLSEAELPTTATIDIFMIRITDTTKSAQAFENNDYDNLNALYYQSLKEIKENIY